METLLPTSKANIVGAARPLPPVTLDTNMAGIKVAGIKVADAGQADCPARQLAPEFSGVGVMAASKALVHALALAETGHACFPCWANKIPACPGGFLAATSDPVPWRNCSSATPAR